LTFRRSDALALAIALFVALFASVAVGQELPPAANQAEPSEADVVRAREEFLQGAELTKTNRWTDALAAFERSLKLRRHAVTTYNIAVCERALGQYTRAREMFRRALEENDAANGAQLAPTLIENTKAYTGQIEQLLVRANVQIAPDEVDIAIDGRPLERDKTAPSTGGGGGGGGTGPADTFVAGTRGAGPGERAPAARFQLLIDPGHHILLLSRAGFKPIALSRSFDAGQTLDLPLVLDKLDARLVVETDRDRAIVTVDDVDVGFAPVSLQRPAGRYHVVIRKKGFVPYVSDVVLDPGATVSLKPRLAEEKVALTQRWWFWTGAAALLVGTGVGVYFATAPSPQRPAPDGGGLGWAADVR
jgi:Tfp pilus assembly protein PilF